MSYTFTRNIPSAAFDDDASSISATPRKWESDLWQLKQSATTEEATVTCINGLPACQPIVRTRYQVIPDIYTAAAGKSAKDPSSIVVDDKYKLPSHRAVQVNQKYWEVWTAEDAAAGIRYDFPAAISLSLEFPSSLDISSEAPSGLLDEFIKSCLIDFSDKAIPALYGVLNPKADIG